MGARLVRVVLALWLLAAMAAAEAQTGELPAALPVHMVLQPVADGVYMVQGESALGSSANANFISNAAVVVADGGVVLVDALGSPALAERLVGLVRGVTALPITHVIVTHYHADHIYGLQVLRRLGARIVAHVGAREYLASDTARLRLAASRHDLWPWVDEGTELVAPDVWVGEGGAADDQVLQVGRTRFVLRHVGPSHTHEDMVVWLPERRVLFAGDLVFRGRIPFVGQADSRHWVQALDGLLGWNATVVVPGHGPMSTTPRDDLLLTREYLQYLRTTMGEAARQMEPFDQAYARTDWSRFSHLPLFGAANRMNAYNTYLQMEQEDGR